AVRRARRRRRPVLRPRGPRPRPQRPRLGGRHGQRPGRGVGALTVGNRGAAEKGTHVPLSWYVHVVSFSPETGTEGDVGVGAAWVCRMWREASGGRLPGRQVLCCALALAASLLAVDHARAATARPTAARAGRAQDRYLRGLRAAGIEPHSQTPSDRQP